MAGLTSEGLTIKTLADVISDYNANAAIEFADQLAPGDIVDTGPNSALGRIIGVVSPPLADVWEAIQQVNDSFSPNAAKGIALDNLIALSGITRLSAAPTRAQVVLEGSLNTVVSSPQGAVSSSVTQRTFSIANPVILNMTGASGVGFVVSTPVAGDTYEFSYTVDNVNYVTTSIVAATSDASAILEQLRVAINAALSGTFTTYYKVGRLFVDRIDPFQIATFELSNNLRAEKVKKPGIVVDNANGAFAAPALTIDTISVPILGWDSVLNPSAAVLGRLQETDEELRERFRNSKFIQSTNILEALIDALTNVTGVTDVKVYENDTELTNEIGAPPKSFMPIVLGGLPTDIANAIWQNKPTGIKSFGDTTVQIADSQSLIHNIAYKQPTAVPIYAKLDISDIGTGLPGDAIALLRQAIVSYGIDNCLIGDDVIYSRFYTPINSIPGHQVNSFTIGTSPNPVGMANITIGFDEVATFSPANITVTITP